MADDLRGQIKNIATELNRYKHLSPNRVRMEELISLCM